MNVETVVSSARSTVAAAFGVTGGLFGVSGRLFEAQLVIDEDAAVPGGTSLLQRGRTWPALVRFAPSDDAQGPRTVSVKIPDAYGAGADQDILLVSSLDGIPWHHAVVPRQTATGLYSSLWLYLAGVRPVVFGARVNATPAPSGRIDFLLAGAASRFETVGRLELGEESPELPRFAASNCGAGLQALPPARLYAD